MQNRVTEFALAVAQEDWEELEDLLETLSEDEPEEFAIQEDLTECLCKVTAIISAEVVVAAADCEHRC